MKLPLLLLLSFLLGASPLRAHEGHDHGDEAKAVATTGNAPRFAVRTDAFELVGVLAGGEFHLYLDRSDGNAPVDGAEIELESAAYKARAERSAPGTYRLKAGPLATPGRHALTFSVTAGDDADLLAVSFDHAPAQAVPASTPLESHRQWILAATLLLGGAIAVALLLRLRRKK